MKLENKIHKSCPICNDTKFNNLVNYSKFHLVKCSNCKLIYAHYIPSKEDLVKHYSKYGRNDYLSPITIKRYHEILDSFEKYRKYNRLLDVGAGIGLFLEVAKERGWEVYGTEYTQEAINICTNKGIVMKQGALTEELFPKAYFDVITSFEVIEHTSYPQTDIQLIYDFLKPSGILYLTTPNFNSIVRRFLKSKWNVIAYPEHLSYFTKKSMHFALTKNNFKKLYLKTQGISITRISTSKNKSNEKFISATSQDEKIRISIENSKFKVLIKNIINIILSITGSGDTIKALYVKKE